MSKEKQGTRFQTIDRHKCGCDACVDMADPNRQAELRGSQVVLSRGIRPLRFIRFAVIAVVGCLLGTAGVTAQESNRGTMSDQKNTQGERHVLKRGLVEIEMLKNVCPALQSVLDKLAIDFPDAFDKREQVSGEIIDEVKSAELAKLEGLFRCFPLNKEITPIPPSEAEQGIYRILLVDIPMARMKGPGNAENSFSVEVTAFVSLGARFKADGTRDLWGRYFVE